jgi:hypothetical protein
MTQNKAGETNNHRTFRQKLNSQRLLVIVAVLAIAGLVGGITLKAHAETYPGGTDNGLTSRLVGLSNTLSGLGYGSTTNSPDWGQYWNRISTAAQWTPSGNAATSDVKSGQTFYSTNRTQQTGTYPAPGACPTQAYHDSYGAPVTQTTNCTANITWTVPTGVAGIDHQDPRTGLTWSQYLANSSGTAVFASTGGSTWTWDASGTNNVAVGNKTAIQLCSGLGNSWRLPTQKELMQAYIDGSDFNLTNPANVFWSATQASSTVAWSAALDNGYTSGLTNTTAYSVRCVR